MGHSNKMLKISFFFGIIISATTANANAIASEMRVGINYVDPYKKSREKNPVLNIEALLQPLKEIFFCPRPHFGASISSREPRVLRRLPGRLN